MEELIENDYKALKNAERQKRSISSTMAGNNGVKLGRGTALQHVSCEQTRLSSEGRNEQHSEGRYTERQPFGSRQSLLPLFPALAAQAAPSRKVRV